MKVGDVGALVRVNPQLASEHARRNYPHMAEAGIVVGWDMFHPVVLYSTGERTMARQNLEVLCESR